MRAVHIHFYRPGSDDHWINHAVTRVSPPYSHCDLQFDTGVATSIYQNETVYMQSKTFSRLNYDCISLTLNEPEYARVYNFCQDAHRRKVGFDLLGMLCSTLPVGLRRPQHVTFCSRYVVEALQQSGDKSFAALDPLLTTPSSLHSAIDNLHSSFLHIPAKRIQGIAFQP